MEDLTQIINHSVDFLPNNVIFEKICRPRFTVLNLASAIIKFTHKLPIGISFFSPINIIGDIKKFWYLSQKILKGGKNVPRIDFFLYIILNEIILFTYLCTMMNVLGSGAQGGRITLSTR